MSSLAMFISGCMWGAIISGGIGWYILGKYYNVRKKLPYRWMCNKGGCHVEFSSSHWDSVMRMADDHNREKHDNEGVM